MKKKIKYLVSAKIPNNLVHFYGLNYFGKVTQYPDALVLRLRLRFGREVEILVTKIEPKKGGRV